MRKLNLRQPKNSHRAAEQVVMMSDLKSNFSWLQNPSTFHDDTLFEISEFPVSSMMVVTESVLVIKERAKRIYTFS